ncbi:helix-turn-helix domain-containing protein [Flaviflexus sp.]|uniref:helix-turn-helix domain-containing protein n=2 Tax=Flaviflexus sp. TaxID=1969482 RepID=UPI003F91C315
MNRHYLYMTAITERAYTVSQCIGVTVNQYLFDAGMTKTSLAQALGVSQPNISTRIHGRADWSAEDLLVTAETLGITIADLVPTRGEDGGWIPAPFKPGYANPPAEAGGENASRLRESNSRPIHYE